MSCNINRLLISSLKTDYFFTILKRVRRIWLYIYEISVVYSCTVAPPAGAWIETSKPEDQETETSVAPPAGAWIETHRLLYHHCYSQVAPPAGAWIETC